MVLLLAFLFVCHYLADFCLTMPVMIRAKAVGSFWPILFHALIHAILMGCCLFIYGVGWLLLLELTAIELVSHSIIDLAKAKIMFKYHFWSDIRYKPYWILYGFDQLLHQVVIILIWFIAVWK